MANDRDDARRFRYIGSELSLRPATHADLDDVHALEVRAFVTPWPRETFVAELENDWSHLDLLRNPVGMLVGYVIYWVVADELHVLNVAVDPLHQRKGLGRELMWYIEEISAERELTYLTLEVRVGNTPALNLYQSLGYQTIQRRKRYYADNNEDALVMAKALDA